MSSLHHKLLRAEQSCKTQVERADYLGDQCALLKEKVADLFQKVTQTEGKQIKTTETTSTGVQTDDTSKVRRVLYCIEWPTL